MKKKSALCLTMVLILILSLLAACGGSTTPAATEAPETTKVPAATKAPEVTQEPEVTEEPQEELLGAYKLPLVDEPTTLSLWSTMRSSALNYVDHLGQIDPFTAAAEHTNVSLEAITIAGNQAKTLFPVMIATGDYTDFMGSVNNLYTGGGDAAISDGVIIDLYDAMQKNAPNYWEMLEVHPEYKRDLITDQGNMPFIAAMSSETGGSATLGLAVRQDWLDKLGLKSPKTYDEMYDVLVAFKNQLGVESPLWLDFQCSGRQNSLVSGYNIAVSNNMNNPVNLGRDYFRYHGTLSRAYFHNRRAHPFRELQCRQPAVFFLEADAIPRRCRRLCRSSRAGTYRAQKSRQRLLPPHRIGNARLESQSSPAEEMTGREVWKYPEAMTAFEGIILFVRQALSL